MKFKGLEWLGAALILLSCGVQLAEGQQMSKLMGGHITWRLENDFETSRNVTWTVQSSWHTSDITYSSVGGGTGVSLVLGRPVVYPEGNDLNNQYGKTFGTLRIQTENGTFTYPNKWIVEYIDGQNVGGSFSVTMQLPERSYVNNASLTLGLGGPMLRSQGEVGDGGTQAIVANGGLPACLFPGATPIPCELYIDGRANSNPLDLFTSLNLPRPEQTELWYTGPHTNLKRVRNRNSPIPVYRPIMQITEPPAPAPAPRFGWRAYDLDGLPYTRHYPAQSTRDGSGNTNVMCANGNLLTTDGCNGLVRFLPFLLSLAVGSLCHQRRKFYPVLEPPLGLGSLTLGPRTDEAVYGVSNSALPSLVMSCPSRLSLKVLTLCSTGQWWAIAPRSTSLCRLRLQVHHRRQGRIRRQ